MRYCTFPDVDTIYVLHNNGGLVQADMRYESNLLCVENHRISLLLT